MSQPDAQKFAALLTDALYQIKHCETKPIAVIQDELGYAMGRNGGSVIESWRKGGTVLQRKQDIELLAELLVKRGRLSQAWLDEYLLSLGYGNEAGVLVARLFPGSETKSVATVITPFQTPAVVGRLVGRQRELEEVCQRLQAEGGLRVVALVGMGGVGKTTLATHAAYGLRGAFADGVLWADAGTSEPMEIAAAWARAFGHDLGSTQGLENRAAALRGILAARRVLLVLDGIRQVAMLQPLLPSGSSCAVLVTTRSVDAAAALGAEILRVEELTSEASLALLAGMVGDERIEAERAAALQVCRQLQNLPLALEIVGQLLRARTQRRLADMATHLDGLDNRLNLSISDRAVRTSFAASWDTLDAAHRAVFACLAVFGGRAFGAEALAYVAELDLYTAEDRLYTLQALSLVREAGADRFQQHALLAAFAKERLGSVGAAHGRMAAYYAEYVNRHCEDDQRLEGEWENIAVALQMAHQVEAWPLLLRLGRQLNGYWFRQARFAQARQGYQLMYDAAAAVGDSRALAYAVQQWGAACLEQDDYAEATQRLEESLGRYEQQGDAGGCAAAHWLLARAAIERQAYTQAQEHIGIYRELCEQLGDTAGVGRACYQRAFLAYLQGDLDTTAALCDEAYAVQSAQHGSVDVLLTYRLLADVAIERHEYGVAEAWCRQGLDLAEVLGNQGEIAALYYSTAVVMRMQGQLVLALDYSRLAQAAFEKMGDRGFLALALYEQSRVYALQGETAAAAAAGEQSCALFRMLEDRFGIVYVLNHLGSLQMELGAQERARAAWQEGLAIAEPLAHPLREQLRQRLAEIELES